jgi:hypothetical protein
MEMVSAWPTYAKKAGVSYTSEQEIQRHLRLSQKLMLI